jgi:hypothetical protein
LGHHHRGATLLRGEPIIGDRDMLFSTTYLGTITAIACTAIAITSLRADGRWLRALSTSVVVAAVVIAILGAGRHNFFFWHDAFRQALPWLAARLGVSGSPREAACPPLGPTPVGRVYDALSTHHRHVRSG